MHTLNVHTLCVRKVYKPVYSLLSVCAASYLQLSELASLQSLWVDTDHGSLLRRHQGLWDFKLD